MRRLRLSWVLVLLALTVGLSASLVRANGNSAPSPEKSNSTTPPIRPQQRSHPDTKTEQTQGLPPSRPEFHTVSQPEPSHSKGTTENQPKQSERDIDWSGWAQAAVAAIGLCIIWRTLKAIEKQVVANEVAAGAAKDSADLARATFLSTHRPKIIVRGAAIMRSTNPANMRNDGVEFMIVNVGPTQGTVFEISARLWAQESWAGLPARPPYIGADSLSKPLQPGEAFRYIHDLGEEEAFAFGYADQRGKPETDLVFLGYIHYRDEAGRQYQTAFARRYDAAAKRFTAVDQTEYEYQD